MQESDERVDETPDLPADAVRDAPPDEFNPSYEWIEAFQAQATEATYQQALKYAYYRVEQIRLDRVENVDNDFVRELVQKAIGDTASGQVTWAPGNVPLVKHLKGVIRYRTRDMIRRGLRFRSVSMDERDTDGEIDERPSEIEASLAAGRGASSVEQNREMTEASELALDLLYRMIAGDTAAAKLLDAWSMRLTERVDVLEHSGLTEAEYHNARRRLAVLARRIPEEIRQAGREALADAERRRGEADLANPRNVRRNPIVAGDLAHGPEAKSSDPAGPDEHADDEDDGEIYF